MIKKLKNILLKSIEKKIIIPYSAKNKKTNKEEPNSRLNPEISSLSPSLKSKGARLVSATQVIKNNGKINNKIIFIFSKREQEFSISKKQKTKKIKEISYDTD
jgi:hypothetical protein